MLKRLMTIAASVLALAATSAMAEDYSDEVHNFRLTIPSGWTSEKPVDPLIRLKLFSPRTPRGVCSVVTSAEPDSRGWSQAEVDADGDRTIDENFWLNGMKAAKSIKDVSIDKHDARMVNGHKAYFVLATITPNLAGAEDQKGKLQQMLEMIPGQLFITTCGVKEAGYPKEQADFDALMNSFAPLGDAPVAMLPSPGVTSLTMYSEPAFGGVSRVVTQDTPDLAPYGWHGLAASISVAGSGAWEVCEGANFSGPCQMVMSASPTGRSGKPFVIASVRHVNPVLVPQQPERVNPVASLSSAIDGVLAR